MIYFCDRCCAFKKKDDFEEHYEYAENICIKCATEGGPSEEELEEGDAFVRTMDQMMFGEEEEDFLPEEEFDVDAYDDDEGDFVYDGEIDEDKEEE